MTLAFAFLMAVSSDARAAQKTDLQTVSSVDLKRYVGVWYEIARYPNRFEKKCAAAVTATYELRDDGKISVLNQCIEANGKTRRAKGKAKVVDPKTNAKLKVTFFWPFYGDYWIIDLDPDYRYAVIGEPNRKYLWILSRTPEMDPATYAAILERLAVKGYDSAKLVPTKTRLGENG